MEIGDIFWAIIWFSVGLVIFEIPSLKRLMEAIGSILSIFSLVLVAMKPESTPEYIRNIPVSYFAGAVTHYIYLIGANIGRAKKFNKQVNVGRIVFYGVIIVVVILVLNYFKPL